MTDLENDFEAGLKQALLDEAESQMPEWVDRLTAITEVNWRQYASRKGYSIEHIWEDRTTSTRRTPNSVQATVRWPFSALFEYGVSPHVIEGNPYLSFVWESPPEGTRPDGAPKYVKTQSVNWGSVTGGIDGSRAIRDGLLQWRGELRS